jgi:hypothetical protein
MGQRPRRANERVSGRWRLTGEATTRLGPLASGAGQAQTWAQTLTDGHGPPGGNTERRERVLVLRTALTRGTRGSTGQRLREGK